LDLIASVLFAGFIVVAVVLESFNIGLSIVYIGLAIVPVIFAALLLYGLRSKRSGFVLDYIVWNVSFYQYFINIQLIGLIIMVLCPFAGYIYPHRANVSSPSTPFNKMQLNNFP
jgi:hypothetical protein